MIDQTLNVSQRLVKELRGAARSIQSLGHADLHLAYALADAWAGSKPLVGLRLMEMLRDCSTCLDSSDLEGALRSLRTAILLVTESR